MRQMHNRNFDMEQAGIAFDGPASHQVQLRAKDETAIFDVLDGETVLCAGLRQGVSLPYECATGTCGSCRAGLVEGVALNLWPEAPGSAFLRPNRAERLLCQTTVSGDCVFELPRQLKKVVEVNRPSHRTGRIAQSSFLARDIMYLRIQLSETLTFAAGQFFLMGTEAVKGQRSYSLANSDNGVSELEIVIKRKSGGALTEWLFSADRVGEQVRIFGPIGSSVFDPTSDHNLLCIVGGSGLAGAMAILSRAAAMGHLESNSAELFFGIRTMQDAFFLDRISELVADFPNLRATIALSDEVPSPDHTGRFQDLQFRHGLVHEVARDEMRGKYRETTAFLAGPPPMVESAIRVLLMDAKLPARNIRYDKFS